MVKKSGIFILLLIIAFSSIACDRARPYSGEQPWYAATAIYSIPGTESNEDDQYISLDQDEYGREMFAAFVRNGWIYADSSQEGVLTVMIMQGRDESEVRFYREQNYLATLIPTDYATTLTEDFVNQYFDPKQIEALKTANDWGQEPSNEYCIRVPLEVEKQKIASDDMRRQAEKEIGSNLRFQFYREAPDGTQVYFVMNIDEKQSSRSWYLIAFDKNEILIKNSAVCIPKDMSTLAFHVDAYWQEYIVKST